MMLNGLMQQCIDLTNGDNTNKELKLKLSKAIYNVARQEYRSDKRKSEYNNKKTIDDIMTGWVNESTKKHVKWIKDNL